MKPDKRANPEYVVQWQGLRIGFCCGHCRSLFERLSEREKAERVRRVLP
jgi:hypothetical protein